METEMMATNKNKLRGNIIQPKTNGNEDVETVGNDMHIPSDSSLKMDTGDESKENASPDVSKTSSNLQDSVT